jgi:CMP-N,N'-diacetyllegionaminic acid synthase
MYKSKKIVAVIPARKGSKGVPDKNIKMLNGVPLVEYTIKQAQESTLIDKIIVSTDSEKIVEIAQKHDIEVEGLRPAHLANDTAILYDVLKYEIGHYNLLDNDFEIMVLLQPTSPLRTSRMIEDALMHYVDLGQESAVGVSKVDESPVFMRTIDEKNELMKILDIDSTVRRQDLPDFYKVNGMIYINKVKDILEGFISFNDNISPIIIPKKYAVDIDTLEDFKKVEEMLKKMP